VSCSPSPTSLRALTSIAALALLLLASAALADGSHQYVGSKKCKTCHRKEAIGNQYGQWEDSKHAKAFETLAGEKAAKWAEEAGVSDPQNDEKCVKCHVTVYDVDPSLLTATYDRSEGVGCEACHGAGKDFRKKKIMMDEEKARAAGLIFHPDEKVCVRCHNDESPAWDPARYTLADGSKVGFDFEQATEAIAHPVPEGYDASAESEAE